ncbi:hypothetical protein PTKIN_Ptkin15bG0181100 [Pterospermum kingtungense]
MKNSLHRLFGFFLFLKKKSPYDQRQRPELPEDLYRQFSLEEIKAATNNFHQDSIIGQGGFGIVYRGTIDDGTMVVAVKRVARSSLQGTREFRTEVQLLSQLRHPHLVHLLGFCVEQNEMIIVYEYMSRGSLDAFLFGNIADVPLGWRQRLQICIGVARGLHYLHTGAKYRVIHRDIKISNVLLDDEWSSRISDFGLSIMGPRSMSKPLIRTTSRIAGTYGYMAPEYAMNGEMTDKSDAFSFGVVLLEVLCGKRTYDLKINGEFSREENIYHVIDPYLKGRIAPDCLKKYLEIACSCVKHNRNERPDMGEVEVTLELALELQEKADSEMEGLNPYGEWMYDEQVSFSVSSFDIFKDRHSESFHVDSFNSEDVLSDVEDLLG